jgi:hypothetical protein
VVENVEIAADLYNAIYTPTLAAIDRLRLGRLYLDAPPGTSSSFSTCNLRAATVPWCQLTAVMTRRRCTMACMGTKQHELKHASEDQVAERPDQESTPRVNGTGAQLYDRHKRP